MFAGAGGGILGGHMLGWRTVCAVEYNAYARSVLLARQNDGTLSPFPVWDDVRTFDGRPWRGIVDVVSGGFPCQDISAAGRGDGLDGERSGLWAEMARIVGEVRPRYVYVENSPVLTSRGLGRVLGDLASLGFDAQWGVVGAADVGAQHQRDRIWIVAHSQLHRVSERRGTASVVSQTEISRGVSGDVGPGMQQQAGEILAHSDSMHEQRKLGGSSDQKGWQKSRERPIGPCGYGFDRWPTEPGMGRVVDGMAHRVDRLKAIGNGQVSRVAAAAFTLLQRD
ncbi:DNA cytosine methyltransferase [Paraburkholderia fungorum]|uniref:DNA cytosine methyltransferase n=1 Tax=Paraburkholderia fungorum TaxID=134537 RepID=UPI00344F76D2